MHHFKLTSYMIGYTICNLYPFLGCPIKYEMRGLDIKINIGLGREMTLAGFHTFCPKLSSVELMYNNLVGCQQAIYDNMIFTLSLLFAVYNSHLYFAGCRRQNATRT